MGKGKQAQRTKNNARPSNSSRSAEFLGSTGQNLMGFSSLKDSGRLCLPIHFFLILKLGRNIYFSYNYNNQFLFLNPFYCNSFKHSKNILY